jgi:hypothetical protein
MLMKRNFDRIAAAMPGFDVTKLPIAEVLNPDQLLKYMALSPLQRGMFCHMVNMAKSVHDDVLDGAFDVLDQADEMNACSAEPLTRTEAITTYALADAVMTPDTDYTKANGDTSGRKCTVAAKATQAIDATGTATHIALTDATRLLYVTTCTSQALTSGGTVSFPAWDVEIADPT